MPVVTETAGIDFYGYVVFGAPTDMSRLTNLKIGSARQRRRDSDESAAICGAANIGTRSAAGRIAETPHAAQPE